MSGFWHSTLALGVSEFLKDRQRFVEIAGSTGVIVGQVPHLAQQPQRPCLTCAQAHLPVIASAALWSSNASR